MRTFCLLGYEIMLQFIERGMNELVLQYLKRFNWSSYAIDTSNCDLLPTLRLIDLSINNVHSKPKKINLDLIKFCSREIFIIPKHSSILF